MWKNDLMNTYQGVSCVNYGVSGPPRPRVQHKTPTWETLISSDGLYESQQGWEERRQVWCGKLVKKWVICPSGLLDFINPCWPCLFSQSVLWPPHLCQPLQLSAAPSDQAADCQEANCPTQLEREWLFMWHVHHFQQAFTISSTDVYRQQ